MKKKKVFLVLILLVKHYQGPFTFVLIDLGSSNNEFLDNTN